MRNLSFSILKRQISIRKLPYSVLKKPISMRKQAFLKIKNILSTVKIRFSIRPKTRFINKV